MGGADILDSEIGDDTVEAWLQEKLEHAAALLSGNGKVSVERVDSLRVDVELNFTVRGLSVADVMERFRDDFRALATIPKASKSRIRRITSSASRALTFPVFVRIDPDSGRPIYTED
jgi:hypothetical protein